MYAVRRIDKRLCEIKDPDSEDRIFSDFVQTLAHM